MSTAAGTANTVAQLDRELNQAVLAGDILGAFEKFYADDVVMQENLDEPKVGKDVNREYEKKFIESVETFHSGAVLSSAVNEAESVSFSEWEYDVTFKGAGRTKLTQVAVRRWKNGKVAHERFYYKGMN